jgi:ubiquinone/menaquinone biosynthesis C-methylase UbiE
MKKQIISNCRKPKGFWGRIMISHMNKHHNSLLNWGLSFCKLSSCKNILDVGCGGGNTIKTLLKLSPAKIYGIDYSELSVKKSINKNKKAIKDSKVAIECGNVNSLAFPTSKFDAVFAVETIYFWEPLDKALSEINRVLVKDGKFIIINELNAKNDNINEFDDLKELIEINIYTQNQLIAALEKADFSIENTYTKENWIAIIAIKN